MAPKSTSLIWNFYSKENANLAKCNLCSKKLLTKNCNTKGLWVHIRSLHPADNIELNKLVNIIFFIFIIWVFIIPSYKYSLDNLITKTKGLKLPRGNIPSAQTFCSNLGLVLIQD